LGGARKAECKYLAQILYQFAQNSVAKSPFYFRAFSLESVFISKSIFVPPDLSVKGATIVWIK
jgi:hypothetical protein